MDLKFEMGYSKPEAIKGPSLRDVKHMLDVKRIMHAEAISL